jgi:hypothetical protein
MRQNSQKASDQVPKLAMPSLVGLAGCVSERKQANALAACFLSLAYTLLVYLIHPCH